MKIPRISNAMGYIDDDLILAAENTSQDHGTRRWSKRIAVAACLCLLCCGGWFMAKQLTFSPSQPKVQILHPSSYPEECSEKLTDTTLPTQSEPILLTEDVLRWTPYYNEATQAIDGALRKDVFLFSQPLTEEELSSFVPPGNPKWMSLEGHGIFYGSGILRHIYLIGTTSLPETAVTITIGAEEPHYCYVLPEESTPSYCNGVEYTLTRYTAPDESITLFGEAKLNDCYYTFSLQGTQDTIAQNETDFALILQSFAGSSIRPEDLATVQPREIPVMFDKPLSYEEARTLEPYGSYFLPEIPTDFTEEAIRHYLDQHTAYLSGLWTRGYDELSWRVSAFTEEGEHRLTHAEETERYDLSLYPIPRADFVPEELREVVDDPIFYAEELSPELIWARAYKAGEQGDSDGWRMAFSVLYGDMVVTVRAKGVDPDWIYKQLTSLSAQ